MPRPLRFVARILTGSTYVVLGIDAVRAPGARVDQAASTLATVQTIVPLPDDDECRIVRGNAALQVLGGALLALGKAQRLSELALAGSLIPTTVAGHAFWEIEDPAAPQATAGPVPQEPGHDRRAAVRRARPAISPSTSTGLAPAGRHASAPQALSVTHLATSRRARRAGHRRIPG